MQILRVKDDEGIVSYQIYSNDGKLVEETTDPPSTWVGIGGKSNHKYTVNLKIDAKELLKALDERIEAAREIAGTTPKHDDDDLVTERDICVIMGVELTDPIEFFTNATINKIPISVLSHSVSGMRMFSDGRPPEGTWKHSFKLRTPDGATCLLEDLTE